MSVLPQLGDRSQYWLDSTAPVHLLLFLFVSFFTATQDLSSMPTTPDQYRIQYSGDNKNYFLKVHVSTGRLIPSCRRLPFLYQNINMITDNPRLENRWCKWDLQVPTQGQGAQRDWKAFVSIIWRLVTNSSTIEISFCSTKLYTQKNALEKSKRLTIPY